MLRDVTMYVLSNSNLTKITIYLTVVQQLGA